MMIRVRYSCKGCGLKAVELEVPARDTEDVITWLDNTRAIVSRNHDQQSPFCLSPCCDLEVPFAEGTQKVGGVRVH